MSDQTGEGYLRNGWAWLRRNRDPQSPTVIAGLAGVERPRAATICPACGCSEDDACLIAVWHEVHLTCHWTDEGICSACQTEEREQGPLRDHRAPVGGGTHAEATAERETRVGRGRGH